MKMCQFTQSDNLRKIVRVSVYFEQIQPIPNALTSKRLGKGGEGGRDGVEPGLRRQGAAASQSRTVADNTSTSTSTSSG